MGVSEIKVKVVATQVSNSVDIEDIDGFADLKDFDDYKRLVYQEGCGAFTTLDFGSNWVQMKRDNEWITQAQFSKEDGSHARIISSEGEIRFEVEVLELEVRDNSIYIKYELGQNGEFIDTHTFNCEWSKEDEAWLEIH